MDLEKSGLRTKGPGVTFSWEVVKDTTISQCGYPGSLKKKKNFTTLFSIDLSMADRENETRGKTGSHASTLSNITGWFKKAIVERRKFLEARH